MVDIQGIYRQARHTALSFRGKGISRNEANYQQKLYNWLATAKQGEFNSRTNAVDICQRCVREKSKSLHLPPGKLTSPPPLPHHIEQFHSPYNRIDHLPDLDFWPPRINNINLSNNIIKKVEAGKLPSTLSSLSISKNLIKKLTGQFPKNLQSFDGSYNPYEVLQPEWPEFLQDLIMKYSGLHFIPDGLPDTIRTLDLSGNPIEKIPREKIPTKLHYLKLARTGITVIPDSLPNSLLDIDMSYNIFDHLVDNIHQPENLPIGLEKADFKGCNLIVPPRCISKLNKNAVIDFRGNPFSENGVRMAQTMQTLQARGPHLAFTQVPRPLADEVASWLEEGGGQATIHSKIKAWQGMKPEPGTGRQMQTLSSFLGRLRETPAYSDAQDSSSFKEYICEIICDMQDNLTFRRRCMQISSESVTAEDDQLTEILADIKSEHVRWKNEYGKKTQIVHLGTRHNYRNACHNPQPNTTYHYHDITLKNNELTFTTDSQGRAIISSGQLRIANQKQRFRTDSKIGYPHNPDALPGDIGFHAGANGLGFPGGHLNVFPGNKHLNSAAGAYGQYENETLQRLVSSRSNVHAQFLRKFNAENKTTRPDTIQIIYKVDGEPRVTRTFFNFSELNHSD